MAKGDFYFPLHYKRLLTSTIGWKDDEFGAYVRLLIAQFDAGSISNDIGELKRIAPSVQKNWPLISKKFKDDGNGGLINDFMNDIYHDAQAKKDKNRKNGKKGGRGRKRENPNETQTKPNGFENETQTKGIPIANSKYQISKVSEEALTLFKIEDCVTIALDDSRWVQATGVTEDDLLAFNDYLVTISEYEKNPIDYKRHFVNWRKKNGFEETKTIAQKQMVR